MKTDNEIIKELDKEVGKKLEKCEIAGFAFMGNISQDYKAKLCKKARQVEKEKFFGILKKWLKKWHHNDEEFEYFCIEYEKFQDNEVTKKKGMKA